MALNKELTPDIKLQGTLTNLTPDGIFTGKDAFEVRALLPTRTQFFCPC